MAQLVERQTLTLKVTGSIPVAVVIKICFNKKIKGYSVMVITVGFDPTDISSILVIPVMRMSFNGRKTV